MEIRVNGRELHATRVPAEPRPGRPTVLGIHGGPGLDHTYLARGLAPLAATADLVLYDQLGNGRSERPAALAGGVEEIADEARGVIDALGLGRVVLFGHSFGGFVALACALRHPERVAALIVSNAAPAFDYEEVVKANGIARATPEVLPFLQQMTSEHARDDEHFRAVWRGAQPIYWHRFDAALFASIDAGTTYSAMAVNHGMAVLPRFDARTRLGAIAVPTLILAGRHDWITPVAEGADRLHAGIPGSTEVVFEESGHFPMFEEPGRFRAVIQAFLAQHAR